MTEKPTDYQKIYDFNNLYKAYKEARKGKRNKQTVAKFETNLLEAIYYLSYLLETKTYTSSPYYSFYVYEPKKRLVKTNAFKDKVVQHALCDNVIEPVLVKCLIKDNYASQPGKGTHFGLDRLEEFMRTYFFRRKAKAEAERKAKGLPRIRVEEGNYAEGWVLKCDITKYFYSIPHEPLKAMVRRYFNDPDVLWLMDLIIDTTEDPGLPIGNQTSQWLALLCLNGMDHFLKEKLRVEFYGRYMDDFYIIHEDKEFLELCKKEIIGYLEPLGLTLNNKTQIFPLRHGIDFLGFHTYITDTGKVIRKVRRESKDKAKKKIRKHRKMLDKGVITLERVEQSYQSWRSHALHGNCYFLVRDTDEYFNKIIKESNKWRRK